MDLLTDKGGEARNIAVNLCMAQPLQQSVPGDSVSMEKAAANPGGEAAAGVGMGIGLAMAQRLAATAATSGPSTPDPGSSTPTRQYHLLAGQQQLGPYTLEQLRVLRDQGQLTVNSLLWHPGVESWQRAADLPELAVLLLAPPPPPPPVPPAVPGP